MDETNSFSATDETRMKHGSESEALLLLSLSVFDPCFIRGSKLSCFRPLSVFDPCFIRGPKLSCFRPLSVFDPCFIRGSFSRPSSSFRGSSSAEHLNPWRAHHHAP